MNLAESTDAIFKDWVTFAAGLSGNPPYAFENEDEDLPTSRGTALFEGTKPWYRVTVRELAGGRANLNGVTGTRKYERTGILSVQFFDLVNKGVKSITQAAEAVRDHFEDRRLNNDIVYLAGTVSQQPPDGKWKPILVDIEFEFTDTK